MQFPSFGFALYRQILCCDKTLEDTLLLEHKDTANEHNNDDDTVKLRKLHHLFVLNSSIFLKLD